MNLPIILIGPMCSGKSTVSKELSKKLSVPHFPVDYLRGYYYLKHGLDLEMHEALQKGDDFKKYVSYVRPFEIDAIEKIVKDPEFRRGIIHFGAGHSFYNTENFLERAKEALKDIDNVILLMPSEDTQESIEILAKRLIERESADGVSEEKIHSMLEVNRMFIEAKSNFELAKTVIYTKDLDVDSIVNTIIGGLK